MSTFSSNYQLTAGGGGGSLAGDRAGVGGSGNNSTLQPPASSRNNFDVRSSASSTDLTRGTGSALAGAGWANTVPLSRVLPEPHHTATSDRENLGPYDVAQVNPPSLTPLPWVRPIPLLAGLGRELR